MNVDAVTFRNIRHSYKMSHNLKEMRQTQLVKV